MTKKSDDRPKFPYSMFPVRLEHKDGTDNKICWFQCQEHAQKYIDRSSLKKNQYTLECNEVNIVNKPKRTSRKKTK